MNSWTQDPAEKLKYKQEIQGDAISTAAWTIAPSGPTIGTPVNTTTSTTVLVSGLTEGTTYTLNVHIICTSGQEFDPSARIQCKKK